MDPNFMFFEPYIIVITWIWIQLLMLMLHKRQKHMAYKIRADNCVWDLCSINSMSTMYACIVF